MKDKKIVFFGTPHFALPSLKALQQQGFNLISVITQPPKPVGRKQTLTASPVENLAKKIGLKIKYDLNLTGLKADLGIVVAYGKIIPEKVLNTWPLGCLNIHPSLLPKYRGPSPIQTAILNGDKLTGVSIIKLDNKIDHGPILKAKKIEIQNTDTQSTLTEKLAYLASELLIAVLPDFFAGKIQLQAQNDQLATFSRILTRADGEIDWQKNKQEIERQIRAFQPWPGSFTRIQYPNQMLKIKIIKASIATTLQEKSLNITETGSWQAQGHQLFVRCQDGFLSINTLQPENKIEMAADQFISGYSQFIISSPSPKSPI